MDRTPAIEIRRATTETLRALAAPLEAAFGEPLSDAEFEEARHTWEPDRTFGAIEDGAPIGTCGNLTFRLTVPGGEVAAAGQTLVGVLPTHRRRGVLRAMMARLFEDARDHGEPVAILWASEGAIYQRFGYGLATLSGSFEISRGRAGFARPAPAEGRVRLVDEAEGLRLMPPVYDKVRATVPGMIDRNEAWWTWEGLRDTEARRSAAGVKFRVVYEVEGVPEGFAIYRLKEAWDDRGPSGALIVTDLVGSTPRAQRDLWAWLLGIDLYPTVKGSRGPVPHPLQVLLAEPRALGLTVGDALWLRLLDMPAALAARRYGAAGALTFDVADATLPANAGPWRLVVDASGVGSLERTDLPADLVLDVADLGAAYLGGLRFGELAAVGRVVERTPGAVGRADALFHAARAPWCSTMF